jgi:hypothetical protein
MWAWIYSRIKATRIASPHLKTAQKKTAGYTSGGKKNK